MFVIKLLFSLVGLLALLAYVQADTSVQLIKKSFPSHRLPTHVLPIHYKVSVDEAKAGVISGRVGIRLKVADNLKASNKKLLSDLILKSTTTTTTNSDDDQEGQKRLFGDNFAANKIFLHVGDTNIKIQSIVLTMIPNGQEVGEPKSIDITDTIGYDEKYQLLALNLKQNLQPGLYGLLRFQFTAPVREDFHGLFEKKLIKREDGSSFTYLTSNFEPINARYMFPCFDEPQFKATFDFSFAHKVLQIIQFNTEEDSSIDVHKNNLQESLMKRTPPMSTNKLAFISGPLAIVGNGDDYVGVCDKFKIRIFAHKGKIISYKEGKFASKVACKALSWMEKYTEIPYELTKFSIVAMANDYHREFVSNWGLAFMKPNLVLLNDENNIDAKARIAFNVANVVAQQWFGNYISSSWWDNLWITETIAAKLASEIIEEEFPELKSNLADENKSNSGLAKYLLEPNSSFDKHLTTPEKINEIFTHSNPTKDASYAQLIENDLGKEVFRQVLKHLLLNNSHGSVDVNAFERAIQVVAKKDPSYLDKFKTLLEFI